MGAETRRRLVRIAERLFAEEGLDSVSIRAVNAAAGVGAASIHYHFGSKEKLIEAVVREQGEAITEQILAGIDELAAQKEPPTALQLVQLIANPYVELLRSQPVRGLRWMKVIAQLTLANDRLLDRMSADVDAAVLEQVKRGFAEVPEAEVALRWAVASRTLIQMLSQVDHWMAHEGLKGKEAQSRYLEDLLDFVAGGLDSVRSGSETSQREARGSRRRASRAA
jgi:AcrR family transcriptional regulator